MNQICSCVDDDSSWWFAEDPEWKGYFKFKLDKEVPGKWSVWSTETALQSIVAPVKEDSLHVNISAQEEHWLNGAWLLPEHFHEVNGIYDISNVLGNYSNHSIDVLYFSAHGAHEEGRFDTPSITDRLNWSFVRRIMKLSGMIIFTGCNVALRNPAVLQSIASLSLCPVIASTEWMRNTNDFRMGCPGVWIKFCS